MRINADFSERIVIEPGRQAWTASPSPGVERIMLDRLGGEVARATSLVRFAPGSMFPRHVHGGGEEFLVLDGVFSDEDGDFGPGSYIRNPMGTAHAPYTKDGATIFVKLWQFQAGDDAQVRIGTRKSVFVPGSVEGLHVLPLHEFGTESVALVRWAAGTRFHRHSHFGGEEIYVIEGTFQDEFGSYPAGTWIRNPHESVHTPYSEDGCLIYVKVGHLSADNGTINDPSAQVGERIRF